MALPFLQPSFQILHGLFPGFNLDLPMPDETPIGSRTLMLECDCDSMIGNPPPQAVETDS
jgi:hypothetical protein